MKVGQTKAGTCLVLEDNGVVSDHSGSDFQTLLSLLSVERITLKSVTFADDETKCLEILCNVCNLECNVYGVVESQTSAMQKEMPKRGLCEVCTFKLLLEYCYENAENL